MQPDPDHVIALFSLAADVGEDAGGDALGRATPLVLVDLIPDQQVEEAPHPVLHVVGQRVAGGAGLVGLPEGGAAVGAGVLPAVQVGVRQGHADLHRISVSELREAALENLSRTPFLASIPKVYSSHDGRTITRTPGISGSAPTVDDEAELLAQMNRVEYGTRVGIIVQALILSALDVLTLEHRLQTADLTNLARRSPIGRGARLCQLHTPPSS